MADAKRKASPQVRRPTGGRRPGGPGGRARDQWTKEDITDQVAILKDDGLSTRQMAVAIGKWLHAKGQQDDDRPMPLPTLKDYIRRAKDMQAETQRASRTENTEAQIRRLMRLKVRAIAAAKLTDAIRIESLLADILGTKAPKRVALSGGGQGAPPVQIATLPKTAPTSDDLRRELETLLQGKSGKKIAAVLADVE